MLKLKVQYFDHLMWRADSLEKILMLGKTEGRRRSGWQRMRWLDGFTDSMHMSLSKFWEIGQGSLAWRAAVHGVTKSQTWCSDWTTTVFSGRGTGFFFVIGHRVRDPWAATRAAVIGERVRKNQKHKSWSLLPSANKNSLVLILFTNCFFFIIFIWERKFINLWYLLLLVAKSCLPLWPHGLSLPGSCVHGILQALILEWVAISFSRRSSPPRDLSDPGI